MLQQLGIRAENGGRVVGKDLLVGLERAQELVELGIARVGLAVNPRRFGVAFALDLLRLAVGGREDLLALAVGVRADAQRLLLALGPVLAGDALALGPHAGVDALLVLFGQVQALDAHVDDADAVALKRLAVGGGRQPIEHVAHLNLIRRGSDHRFQIVRADRRRQRRPDDIVQAHLGSRRVADGFDETLRILDLPGDIGLDDEVLLVARQELARPRIVDAEPPVEIVRPLVKPFGVQAGVGDRVQRTAELGHQDEFRLAH
jgi:hypothetical protein